MSKLVNNHPFLLGFNKIEEALEKAYKSAEGYPPYNIEEKSNDTILISLAVAGFDEDELEVALDNNQLVVKGQRKEEETDGVFIHKGIASRKFQKTFLLADGLEPTSSVLDKGILTIELKKKNQLKEIKIININKK